MIIFDESCSICNIVNGGSDLLSDVALWEDEDFYIMPTLGCLVPGYILILSKEHIYSSCYLNAGKRTKLQNLLERLSKIYEANYGFNPLIFEHGGAQSHVNKSACCIWHCHIHIVPHLFTNTDNMVDSLKLTGIESFEDFFDKCSDTSYLFFADNQGNKFIQLFNSAVEAAPSQIFRKWIAKDIGIPQQWDWRTNTFKENIFKTIVEIGALLRNANLSNLEHDIKNVYYCSAMDGLSLGEISTKYHSMKQRLEENNMTLINSYEKQATSQIINKESGSSIVSENLKFLNKADYVIVDLSIPNRLYIGCIDEMITAHQKGIFVIVVKGYSVADKHFYTHFRSDKIVKTLDEAIHFLIEHSSNI